MTEIIAALRKLGHVIARVATDDEHVRVFSDSGELLYKGPASDAVPQKADAPKYTTKDALMTAASAVK